MANAIESIYRDLEYARSLIKRTPSDIDSEDGEDATIRDHSRRHSTQSTPDRRRSGYSAPSEDWSVIDQDDRRSSLNSQNSENKAERSSTYKRNSLAAAVLSVLPDALTSSPSHRRASTASSQS